MRRLRNITIFTVMLISMLTVSVFAVTANEEEVVMPVRKEQQITTPQDRYGVAPTHKPFRLFVKSKTPVTYESSNPSVATVNSKGVVTPKKVGDAYITITASETREYKSDIKKVHIDINNYKAANGTTVSASSNLDNKPGDSSGKECKVGGYTYNKKVACYNWNFIIRCTDPAIANKASQAVYYITKNNNFGYNAHKATSQKEVNKRRQVYDKVHKAVGDNPSYNNLKKILKIKGKADTSCSPTLLAGYWLYYDMDSKIKLNWRKPYDKKYYYYNCGSVNIEQNGVKKAIKKVNKEYTDAGKLAPFQIIEVPKNQRDAYFSKSNMKRKLKRGDIIGALPVPSKNGHTVMIR